MLTELDARPGLEPGPEPELLGHASRPIDGIEYRLYSNQEAMVQALKNGEIDIADGVDPPLVASLEGTDTVTVQHVVSDWWLNLAFNFGGQGPDANPLPALHDHDVRLAIAMAIDKQAIADKVYQGTATPGDTFIRPASAYWHLDIPADEEIPFDSRARTPSRHRPATSTPTATGSGRTPTASRSTC